MAQVKRRRTPPQPRTWRTAAGHVLTDADFEALSGEAEAGYDLSKARVEHVGRPSLGVGVSPRVTFRTSAELYATMHARATREHRSVSDLAREAVAQYLKRTESDPAAAAAAEVTRPVRVSRGRRSIATASPTRRPGRRQHPV